MKPTEISFRDAVYHDGKKSLVAGDNATLELHAVGVIVQAKGRKRVLVPFSNVLWIGVEAEPALAPKKP